MISRCSPSLTRINRLREACSSFSEAKDRLGATKTGDGSGAVLFDRHCRVHVRALSVEVLYHEPDNVFAGCGIQFLPHERIGAKGQRVAILGGGLRDSSVGIQVQPRLLHGEGVAGVGQDLSRRGCGAIAGVSEDLLYLAALQDKLRWAGVAVVGVGIGAGHRVDGLFRRRAVGLRPQQHRGRRLVVGVVSQDDDEAPFDSGYRILPRRSADVQPGAKMQTTAAPMLDEAAWNAAPLFLPVTGAAGQPPSFTASWTQHIYPAPAD